MTNSKSQSSDVRRQLFMSITKKIKTGRTSNRHEDIASGTLADHAPQFLHPSTSHTVPKSPRSKRITQHALAPASTFTAHNTSSSSLAAADSSRELVMAPTAVAVKPDHETRPAVHQPQSLRPFVLHKKEDISEYDYHTFASQHRLRTSKIKALEQAEVTTSLYFNFEQNTGVEEALNRAEADDVLICLPGLDRDATKIEMEQMDLKFHQARRRGT